MSAEATGRGVNSIGSVAQSPNPIARVRPDGVARRLRSTNPLPGRRSLRRAPVARGRRRRATPRRRWRAPARPAQNLAALSFLGRRRRRSTHSSRTMAHQQASPDSSACCTRARTARSPLGAQQVNPRRGVDEDQSLTFAALTLQLCDIRKIGTRPACLTSSAMRLRRLKSRTAVTIASRLVLARAPPPPHRIRQVTIRNINGGLHASILSRIGLQTKRASPGDVRRSTYVAGAASPEAKLRMSRLLARPAVRRFGQALSP